ncbi:MAG: helix-turn-helix domain-containing protein [Candidatus Asgardarchaeia archaeon]
MSSKGRKILVSRAFLRNLRNVERGITSRSHILLKIMRMGPLNAKEIADATGLSYNSILHHLRLMEKERVVRKIRKGKCFLWEVTEMGQTSLEDFRTSQ